MRTQIENVQPKDIETKSFEIITRELNGRTFENNTELIVKRCIHTSADFDYADNLCFSDDVVEKEVHWYLMMANSYYSKPQREEYFVDSGYYKFHEAYHLLKFSNERQILEMAYQQYLELRRANLWGTRKYF